MKNVFFFSKEMPEYLQYLAPSLVIISTKDQDKLEPIKNWLYSSDGGFISILFFYLF
jgi:hypothetical protein